MDSRKKGAHTFGYFDYAGIIANGTVLFECDFI